MKGKHTVLGTMPRPVVLGLMVVIAACLVLATLVAALPVSAKGVGNTPGAWFSLAPLPDPDGGGPSNGATEGAAVSGKGSMTVAAYGNDGVAGDTRYTRLYDIATDTWSMGAMAPAPARAELAYGDTTHGNMTYAIGGRAFGGVLNNVERYDVAADTWTTMTAMRVNRSAPAAAVVGNAIYVIGGRDSGGGPASGNPLDVVERYDIASDTWTTVAPLPGNRSDLAAVAHGGKIYAFGGYGSGGVALNNVDVYNPVTDTWTALAPMPTARGSLVAGKLGNRVYAVGGMTTAQTGLQTVEVYNIPKDTWAADTSLPAATLPNGLGESGAYSHGGRVYIVGGGQPAYGSSTNVHLVFEP